jgi:hypothetical protein
MILFIVTLVVVLDTFLATVCRVPSVTTVLDSYAPLVPAHLLGFY